MFHKFSLVTGVGFGVLHAPVSCWCPRGRLAPLCYASLAGDGLLVATHHHRHQPHTNRKYKDFTKHSFVFCSFHHCGFWAAISSSFVQIHMCLKKLQNILKMLVLLLRHVTTVTPCYGYDPGGSVWRPWPGPRHRPLITISVTSVGRCVAQ